MSDPYIHLEEQLCQKLEPHVSTSRERFEVLMKMKERGIPTVVWLDPILPYINDTKENIQGILEYCKEAKVKGIICFGMGLTLRDGNREYFYKQLDRFFPGLAQRYIQTFGTAYEIHSPHNLELMEYARGVCNKHDIMFQVDKVFEYLHTWEEKEHYTQLRLTLE